VKKQTKISSRDLGLEFAAICGRYFLGLEHLHYGYWPEGLAAEISSLRLAQEKYTQFLISHIPAGVRTILDVGCGSGQTSKQLVDMGYKVACVSPSPTLSQQVRQLLGNSGRVFECQYEKLETEDKFDLVLFSESFQYINLEKALEKTFELLNPASWLLICDIFRKDIEGSSGVGGGHRLAKFQTNIANYPFELIEDMDITERTAPNLDLLDETLRKVARPLLESSMNFISGRYPLMSRFMRWKYRKRIDTVYSKYFDGHRTSEDFHNFKSYRLFLYRNNCAVDVKSNHPANPLTLCCRNTSVTPL
jgi:SAM-dependent methyltransferase